MLPSERLYPIIGEISYLNCVSSANVALPKRRAGNSSKRFIVSNPFYKIVMRLYHREMSF
jgi:hypothetical protein